MTSTRTNDVRDNPGQQRLEMSVGDAVAFVKYRREGDRIVLTHTEVPNALSGQGVGSKLVRGVLDHLRADGVDVAAECDFVKNYVRHHPEYLDMLTGLS